jgi:NAD(P)-dependent dehydrogenase (short-subunit alcohol dehydrogenase family)
MKILVVGAGGTIGKVVSARLREKGHQVVEASRAGGLDLINRASLRSYFAREGKFGAVAVAAGHVAFKPVAGLTEEDLLSSANSKFLGQVRLVQEALPFIEDNGSIVLISGVTAREPIRDGALASGVARAVEGFVMGAAPEMPRGIRINVISPTVLDESAVAYADYFAGHESVKGSRVADSYLKAIAGRMTGTTLIP